MGPSVCSQAAANFFSGASFSLILLYFLCLHFDQKEKDILTFGWVSFVFIFVTLIPGSKAFWNIVFINPDPRSQVVHGHHFTATLSNRLKPCLASEVSNQPSEAKNRDVKCDHGQTGFKLK